ncbi:hypothetical protein UlMin_019658 [Ulmus minor]
MEKIPYASTVGSLMYAMLCTRPDICYAVGIVSRYQSNPRPNHWVAVKHILKYLKRTRDYMLVYSGEDLTPLGYTDSNFQSDKDSRKSTSGLVFTLGGGAIVWRSIKQSCITDSTMEAEYVAASEAFKEVVWLRKFLSGLEVIPGMDRPITLYCDNTTAILSETVSGKFRAPAGLAYRAPGCTEIRVRNFGFQLVFWVVLMVYLYFKCIYF